MKLSSDVGTILCLLGCLCFIVDVETADCSNGAGYCDFYTTYLNCYINNNDTQLIKTLLRGCSDASSSFTSIYVYKNYISNQYGNLLIDFDLPTNLQSLYINNYQDQDHIRITTFVQNNALTRISSSNFLELETNLFFMNFRNMQYIYAGNLLSTEVPSFANLQSLTYLYVRFVSTVTHTFKDSILNGSSNLISLRLSDSSFDGITKGAFLGLNQLTYLNFARNKLTFIEEGLFTDQLSLKNLQLYDNKLISVPDNVFEGLNELTYIDLDNNPGFPINALLSARYLETLFLQYNEYETLGPYVFQQIKSLRYLYLNDPFICDCRLQWTSFLNQYGINIYSPTCSEPSDFNRRSITNQQIYVNCSQTQTYQCFNQSNTCPTNLVCHNTEDSYICACPIGYVLHASGECKDIDECAEETECQQVCVNTEGSFNCACEEGYAIASNGYDCDDVNECQEGNGGCQFGCSNTAGSYQCYCEYGHKLKNDTHCEEGIECELSERKCIDDKQCNYICKGGYNLTISSPTCPNADPIETTSVQQQECELNILSIVLVGVLLAFLAFLIIVNIALFVCVLRKSNKSRKNLPEPKEHKYTVSAQNNEALYNYIDESPQLGNLRGNATPQSKPKPRNVVAPQQYPGSIQEDTNPYYTDMK